MNDPLATSSTPGVRLTQCRLVPLIVVHHAEEVALVKARLRRSTAVEPLHTKAIIAIELWLSRRRRQPIEAAHAEVAHVKVDWEVAVVRGPQWWVARLWTCRAGARRSITRLDKQFQAALLLRRRGHGGSCTG